MTVMFVDWVGGNLPEWTFISSTQTTTNTLTLPSAINAGDLLIIFSAAETNSSPPTLVTPSGFTNKHNSTASESIAHSRYSIFVKKASGSEDSTSVSITDGAGSQSGLCLQFRPVNFSITSAANITLDNFVSDARGGSPPSIEAITTGVKLPAIAFGSQATYFRSGSITFSTQSPTFDGLVQLTSGSNTFQQTVGYRIQSDLVQSQTVDMVDYGNINVLTAFQLYDNGL